MEGRLCTDWDVHASGGLAQWTVISKFDCEIKSMEIPNRHTKTARDLVFFSITMRKLREAALKGISMHYPFFLPKLTTS
jgi:hypothetical protein